MSHVTPGSLSRHFLRKQVKKLEDRAHIDYQICDIRIEYQIALLVHAERFHRTISQGPAKRLVTQIS